MRVLHVIDNLQVAGAETLVRDLAVRQKAAGLDVSVLVLHTLGTPLEADLPRAGVPLHSAGLPSSRDPRSILALRRAFARLRPDVAHVHLFPAQLWAAAATVGLSRAPRLVTTEHSTHNKRRRFPFRALDAWTYGRYAAVACISQGTRNALLDWQPRLAAKALVIPNGVDLTRFARPAGLPDREPGQTRLISVGRFVPEKNQALLIQALPELPDVSVDFVGDGPLLPECQSLAARLGVSDRARFLGRRADVPQLLWNADAYVQTSRWEGFGLATLEAMAAGLPVIVSDVPGLAEVVGEAGLSFPEGDVGGLARAVERLRANPRDRLALARAAADRAQQFGIEETVRRYGDLYEKALPSHAHGGPGRAGVSRG